MTNSKENEALLREIQRVLRDYGIEAPMAADAEEKASEIRAAERIARHLVDGRLDLTAIDQLDVQALALIPRIVERMIGGRRLPGVRALQENNPYYGLSPSRIVDDSEEG